MGAIDTARLQHLKTRSIPPDAGWSGQYLYSSGYSSPLCLFIWLLRLEPFTSMHIQMQSGRFDVAARLFTSVGSAYELSSMTVGDYRELIPEFFCDNVFLLNLNKFNLGKIGNCQLNDVEIPPWCHDTLEFVYLHRKALESEFVRQRIHTWIDLVWGFRQTGAAAVEADNVFYPLLYETVWASQNHNPDDQHEIEATLDSCGQIPQQLFFEPHPQQLPAKKQTWLAKPTFMDVESTKILDVINNTLLCLKVDKIFAISIRVDERNRPVVDVQTWDVVVPPFKLIAKFDRTKICAILKSGTLAIIQPTGLSQASSRTVINLAANKEFICLGKIDTSITICKNLQVLETFPSFIDEIVCSAVSASYDLIVVGAHASSLFLISPSHRTITRVINLENRNPYRIEITEGWGFIVVYEKQILSKKKFIELFTVNGEFIRRTELDYSIRAWSSWKSKEGFDYLAISPKSGKLRVYEVFYLKCYLLNEICYGLQRVFYSESLSVLFANYDDGKILMIPFRPPF
jgi:hypothetical protein